MTQAPSLPVWRSMLFVPVTIFLRLVFRIKYIWETPWFSI